MKKRVFNLIIVDESGSMSIIHQQAFAGMNETMETVRSIQKKYPETEQRITLITFDSDHTKYHYDNQPADMTDNLKWESYNPSGATPLYDAMGSAISRLNAMTEKDDNVIVTVITDGEENCSREWNLKMIRGLIEKLKEQNWTFTLIGTDNLDVESMAHSMAIDEHMEFKQDVEGTREMFKLNSDALCNFNCCLSEEREIPKGSYFKKKKSSEA